MKNKIITFLVIITIMLILIIPTNIYAKMDTNISINNTNAMKSSENVTSRFLGTLQVAGSAVAIIGLIIIGMRYMFGSIEEKSNTKGVMMYYVIGAILVFATAQFLGFAYTIITTAF